MSEPVAFAMDRSIRVPPGAVVKTGYVDIFKCRLACRERMAVGDVKLAYEKVLQQAGHAVWPFPNGYWDGDEFVIKDGRHEYIASLMVGHSHILVAWVDRCES